MSFSDKVVLVTGASSGIGAAIAILFSKEGANVAMVGRNTTKLKNVACQCANAPLVIVADVTNDSECKRIVEETIAKFGKLDVLVNNAGMAKNGSLLNGKLLEAYDETMCVNLRAVISITSLATPYIIESKGNIINISSSLSLTVPMMPTFLPYGISKAGLDHFTKGAALELSTSGVRVNSVNPGPVITDFLENNGNADMSWDHVKELTALKRVSQPEEVADLVVFLAGDKAKGITGSIFLCDNGSLLKK